MAVHSYPTSQPAVLEAADGSFSFFSEGSSNAVIGYFKYGQGFACYADGTPRLLFTRGGVTWCDRDGATRDKWTWADAASRGAQSMALSPYLTLTWSDEVSIAVTFRGGQGTESFAVGKPSWKSYVDSSTPDPTTGHLQIPLDKKKHPSLILRSLPTKASKGNDALPRLSASGRESASLALPASLATVEKNHAATLAFGRDFTTDLEEKMRAIRKTVAMLAKGGRLSAHVATAALPELSSDPSSPPRMKRFLAKGTPLKKLPGGKVAEYLSSIRSDQLAVVCCSDMTSKECRAAEAMLRDFLAEALNQRLRFPPSLRALVQNALLRLLPMPVFRDQSTCASKVDASALLNQLDCQV